MTDQIKKRIKQLGLKKGHVAEQIGVSHSMFSHYLGGRKNIPFEASEKLKKYLSIN